jgi:hypothetical protein
MNILSYIPRCINELRSSKIILVLETGDLIFI